MIPSPRPSPRPSPGAGPSPPRRPRRLRALLLAAAAAPLAAGCEGPSLHLASDGPRYVDGFADEREELPFRYYGTTVVDVLPADDADGQADWSRQPARQPIELPPPVTRWLFPLDFPIELVQRLAGPAPDRHQAVRAAEADEQVVTGFLPGGIDTLRERAGRARTSR